MPYAVLIVEDEAKLAANIRTYLKRSGYEAETAGSAEEGLARLDGFKPDAVLLDLRLPGMDGLTALARFREADPKMSVILVTGHGSVETAVEAMKSGAYDFVTKPVSLSKLKLLLDKALGDERKEQALHYYQRRDAEYSGLDKLIGESAPMRALRQKIAQVIEAERQLTDADAPAVLIAGETGTGKELVARALHFSGHRRSSSFVEINCAALPAQLLESELFGHERGAFTDARERKLGLVETAEGGTLFLDEIGDMDLALQAKLLKLLEERTLRRVGSLRDQKGNVRIIAATHRALESLVEAGKFRSDLYFRLRVVELAVPPLRERGEDILLLTRHFLAVHGSRYNKPGLRLAPAAERLLAAHRWPGNVRELRNLIEKTVLLAQRDTVEAAELALPSPAAANPQEPERPEGENLELAQAERGLLRQALERADWNVTHAARLLGVSRDTLRYRIEKHGLIRDDAAGAKSGS